MRGPVSSSIETEHMDREKVVSCSAGASIERGDLDQHLVFSLLLRHQ